MQVMSNTVGRRMLTVAAAAASLAAMMTAGQAVVAATDAHAATFCGSYKDAGARTSSRYGRVRTQACLENSGNSTRAVNRTIVDKPSGCTWGATTSGIGYTCPPSAASLWPEFHGFQLDVRHDSSGIYRCSWGSNGGHALEFNCYSPWKAGLGAHSARAQTCFDVKDDGAPWYCTETATFSRTF